MKRLLVLACTIGMLASVCVQAGDDAELLVVIKDFEFIPQEITIRKGQTLVWENRELRQYHSVWFEALGEKNRITSFPMKPMSALSTRPALSPTDAVRTPG